MVKETVVQPQPANHVQSSPSLNLAMRDITNNNAALPTSHFPARCNMQTTLFEPRACRACLLPRLHD
jgi:hypothetical protein